jgi:hypothetical protein
MEGEKNDLTRGLVTLVATVIATAVAAGFACAHGEPLSALYYGPLAGAAALCVVGGACSAAFDTHRYEKS